MAITYSTTWTVGADTDIESFDSGAWDYCLGTDLTVYDGTDRVGPTATRSFARCVASGQPTSDYEVRTNDLFGSGDTFGIIGLYASGADGTLDAYWIICRGTTGDVRLVRTNAGGNTVLRTWVTAVSSGDAARIRAIVNGSQVDFEVEVGASGTLTYSDTDGSRLTSGVPMVGGDGPGGNVGPTFEVDDLASGGALFRPYFF